MENNIRDKVTDFFASFPLRTYPKGQILIHAGDSPERIYFIVSGNVRQYDISYRGDQLIVNVFRSGAFFPMNYVVADIVNRFFFECETEVKTHVAPPEQVEKFLRDNPEVTYDLLRRVYRGMDGILGRMLHLMGSSARGRLLYELIIECKRSGKPGKNGRYLISLKENDLAARAGLTRETVSREIGKIGKDGLVNVSQQGIEVASLEELEKLLGPEL